MSVQSTAILYVCHDILNVTNSNPAISAPVDKKSITNHFNSKRNSKDNGEEPESFRLGDSGTSRR